MGESSHRRKVAPKGASKRSSGSAVEGTTAGILQGNGTPEGGKRLREGTALCHNIHCTLSPFLSLNSFTKYTLFFSAPVEYFTLPLYS
uniref:Uncharacterized protein n=1 Tax=Globodera rostochiensis TaxID=31243 RepID=A0A914HBD8_GLORO